MPPVECTSSANGAEAPQYLALSPLVEEYPYSPFMDFHQPLLRQEIFLSSAALPDTPNPLVSTLLVLCYIVFIFELGFYLTGSKQ